MSTEIQTPESETDAWTDFDQAFDALRQRFLTAWGVAPVDAAAPTGSSATPVVRAARTDVQDLGASYRIVAEVPGVPKEKIDIRVRGTEVEIVGESATASESANPEYVYRERRSTAFRRSLELPEPVVAAEAKAKVENGLLELDLPKQHPTPSPAEVRVAVQ